NFQIEQHDHEQEQHDHRPGIDQDLHRGEEERIQQHKKSRQRRNREHQKHRAGDRAAAQRISDHEKAAEKSQQSEEVEEEVLHGNYDAPPPKHQTPNTKHRKSSNPQVPTSAPNGPMALGVWGLM